jgi:hypothetical protein
LATDIGMMESKEVPNKFMRGYTDNRSSRLAHGLQSSQNDFSCLRVAWQPGFSSQAGLTRLQIASNAPAVTPLGFFNVCGFFLRMAYLSFIVIPPPDLFLIKKSLPLFNELLRKVYYLKEMTNAHDFMDLLERFNKE